MHRARYVFLVLAFAWAGLIFYLSSQPGIDAPMLFPGQDKLFHLIVFAILGFFLMGAMKITGNGYRRSQVWMVVLIVVLYGISDEFHQYFVPGRSTESLDALADGDEIFVTQSAVVLETLISKYLFNIIQEINLLQTEHLGCRT